MQKNVMAIHDISGFGKCSLTVALPIISAGGIRTTVLPTALLSTHTGGFSGFVYKDLTDLMEPITSHWKTLGIEFDSIYTGFLGSFKQLDIVSEIIDRFQTDNSLIMVDPVMADHGKLYSVFNQDFVLGMKKLCQKAHIIVPNITEALLLLGVPYFEEPYEHAFINDVLLELSKLGPDKIVLTGIQLSNNTFGIATYEKSSNTFSFLESKKLEGQFHGTGDIFSSALLSGLLNGFSLIDSGKIALDFTYKSILKTIDSKIDLRYGVEFESQLPTLIKSLNLL